MIAACYNQLWKLMGKVDTANFGQPKSSGRVVAGICREQLIKTFNLTICEFLEKGSKINGTLNSGNMFGAMQCVQRNYIEKIKTLKPFLVPFLFRHAD